MGRRRRVQVRIIVRRPKVVELDNIGAAGLVARAMIVEFRVSRILRVIVVAEPC